MKKAKGTGRPHFDPLKFGKRLQNTRKALGITQEELADRISVDRNHITRMERGIRVCSIDLLVELAAVLDVSTDYLLVGTVDTYTEKRALLVAIEKLGEIVQSL